MLGVGAALLGAGAFVWSRPTPHQGAVYLRRIVEILEQVNQTAAPQRATAATPPEAGALDRLRFLAGPG